MSINQLLTTPPTEEKKHHYCYWTTWYKKKRVYGAIWDLRFKHFGLAAKTKPIKLIDAEIAIALRFFIRLSKEGISKTIFNEYHNEWLKIARNEYDEQINCLKHF